MSDARHTPPGDDSFRASLLRNGAGAVGLVALVAVIFWAIGTLGGDRSLQAGADSSDDEVAAPDEPEEADPELEPEPDEPEPEPDEPEPEPEPDEPEPEPEPDDGDTEDGSDGDAGEQAAGGDADDEGDRGTVERTVAPGEVTVQVLDGFKEDGGTAADAVADLLGGAGYQVIARNDALTYEVTTVLYNPGNEAAAQQVAAELGGAEVRQQPGNLSSAVALHVVVGRDRG